MSHPAPHPPSDLAPETLTLRDNPQARRFELALYGEVIGFAEYRLAPGTITFFHTVIDEPYEGRGLAGKLARFALDTVRALGERRVVAECRFFAGWIQKHPDYADLIAPEETP